MRNPDNFQKLRCRRAQTYRRWLSDRFIKVDNATQAGRDAGCYKAAYASKAQAEKKAAQLNATGAVHLRHAYRCPHCSAWHNTSQRG